MMNLLGLDPAATCGWAHSSGEHGVWQLVVRGDKHPGRRLERLRRKLFTLKRTHGIDAIGCEDAAFGASRNLHTASMHSELRGIIKLCGAEWEIPVHLYKPTHLKMWLTGRGTADKATMIRFVKQRFDIETDDDNVADAIAVMGRLQEELNCPGEWKW